MAYLPCSLRAAMLLFMENVLFSKAFKRLLSPVLLAVVLLVSCRGGEIEDEDTALDAEPTPEVTASPTPETTAAPNVVATPTAAPKPTPEATEVPKASSDTVTTEAQLPNALLKTWEPVSNVLYEFGPMVVTSDRVQWEKGQSSSYTVVSSAEGSYLLKLEAAPSFYDTPHPYIKLIPEMNAAGEMTGDMEVAFYENEAAAQQDQYIMFGSYF